ncbi:hypothetical protein BegalDRAFT_3300 [Beggiatoa alba B18LD]|uniref:Uncharacterized protein n=1 Tax=Beggiatoa alba B18LD TaxID=395493 RepID=I3CKH6_9GAMM|nr:restriction endonuclease [Beggiatoa alba]EIJ44119.1 hypothetical protein BegalDRAFT_3300 [Beggiatoa alba B18LD]
MTDYDFKTLNDKEFEVLCTDLLSSEYGVRYERFKAGRDGGVDGRFFSSDGKETILQCKHWISTPLNTLISRLESEEKPKVEKLKPARYILMLSHPLSREDKTKIVKIFAPYLKDSDIFGKEDLNDLLARHAEVERRHYKLWLSSTNVLQYMLNKPIYDRSNDEFKSIRESAHLYIKTENHDRAIKKLEARRTVIITGSAGIGKTTLARHLLLHYVLEDFKLFVISEDIQEAEEVFQNSEKQLFYFDDFLGRNYLEALTGHEGSKIVHFIGRVRKSPNTRLLLTSRTTILNQGKIFHDEFQHNKLDQNEYELTLDSLSNLDKAKILYNHLWHSNLAKDFIEQIYLNKRYRDVIKHQNFNPRLINYITDPDRVSSDDTPIAEYWNYISKTLDNPIDVWEHSFTVQLDDFGRALVLLVTLNMRSIDESLLSEAYQRYVSIPEHNNLHGKRDFSLNIKHLTGSFLKRVIYGKNEPFFNLFNPSVGDYILRRYANDTVSLKAGFLSLRTINSLNTLSDLSKNEIINSTIAKNIAEGLLDKAVLVSFKDYLPDYIAKLILIVRTHNSSLVPSEPNIAKAIDFLVNLSSDITSEIDANNIAEGLAEGLLDKAVLVSFKDYLPDYIAKLILIVRAYNSSLVPSEPNIAKAIDFLVNSSSGITSGNGLDVIDWAFTHKVIAQEWVFNFMQEKIPKFGEWDDLITISLIISKFDGETQKLVISSFIESVVTYFEYYVRDDFSPEDVFGSIEEGDYSGAEDKLLELIEEKIDVLALAGDLGVFITSNDKKRIVNAFDIKEQHDEYFYSLKSNYYEDYLHNTTTDEIDDLFERA